MSVVKVATLNLRGRHDRWLQRRGLIVAELLTAQPDLFSMQEIYRPFGQARWLRNQVNVRLSGSPKRPYRLIQKPLTNLIRGRFEAIGILTKLPVISVDSVSLGYGGRIALRANVELPSRETLDFLAIHLHPVTLDREVRTEQVLRLTGWLKSHNSAPFQVLAGDFNEVPAGPAITLMKQSYRSALFEFRGHEPLATYPTALVKRQDDWSGCIDYIFISNAVPEVLQAEVFCKKPDPNDPTLYPSDHIGLLATLSLGRQI